MRRGFFPWGRLLLVMLAVILTCHVSSRQAEAQFPPPPGVFANCVNCHTGFQGGGFITGLHAEHIPYLGNAGCNVCHGGETAPACNFCHDVVSTDFGVEAHDFRTGPGAPGHDFHVQDQNIDCTECHGPGFAGGPLREPFGDCATCHAGFQNGTSGPLHQQHTAQFGAADCTICHGDNAPACNQCHDVLSSEHDLRVHDFRNGPGAPGHDFHTSSQPGIPQLPIIDCERCHVSGIAGGPLSEPFGECAFCHRGFKRINGTTGPLHQDHTQQFGAGDCSICHGENAPACNECHDVVSNEWGMMFHDFRNGIGAPGHDFHTNFIGNCTLCHVSGIAVGPLREPFGECAQCHPGFQGGPSGDLHQQHTMEFGAMDCTTCHGEEAPACNECHQEDRHDFRFGPGAEGHDFHTDVREIDCEVCHVTGVPDVTPIHEVGNTDCTGCHYTNLLPQHDDECGTCHGSDDQQVQEAIANNNINCYACHGQMPHAMDCMLCHDDENFNNYRGPRGAREIHDEHMDFVTCGVCHEITENLEPLNSCGLCHSSRGYRSARSVHREHMEEFGNVAVPCFWCHGYAPPAPPENSCDLCHSGRSGDMQRAHRIHGEDFACTVCHGTAADFGFDVRTGTPRRDVCTVCHEVENEGFREVHEEHMEEAQCFACHGRSNIYASMRGDLDCTICHSFENEGFRDIHQEHVGEGAMCAVCHAAVPPSVPGINGENSIPGFGTLPEMEPGPPTPGPGAGLGGHDGDGDYDHDDDDDDHDRDDDDDDRYGRWSWGFRWR